MHTLYRNTIILGFCFIFFICYWHGLYSPFFFDDYANLNKLGDLNGIKDLDSFLRYILSGIAGPTGRPISLLSFLVDATNWPTDPLPFKRTNLIIHLACGLLLFLTTKNIVKVFNNNDENTVFWSGFLTAVIWLLHPFFVSTVLYAVQRMAMLSTFFVLLGLFLYTSGRLQIKNKPKKAYYLMSLAAVLCTALATLSKENGALLPLLLLIIEYTIYSHPTSSLNRLNKIWLFVFLIFPSCLVIGYLFLPLFTDNLFSPRGSRNFSIYERLLTEARIVTQYLYNLYIPQMHYQGLFNENYPISKNLFNPTTTIYSIFFLASLIITSFVIRRKNPYISLAILFFFAAHIMESSVLALELYFEHRNYLPAIFLFLPITEAFNRKKLFFKTSLGLFILILSIFTYQRTSLWSSTDELSLFWAAQNPTSQRAQRSAALTLEKNNKPGMAIMLLTNADKNIVNNIYIKLHLLVVKCRNQKLVQNEYNQIIELLPAYRFNPRIYNLLESAVSTISNAGCKDINEKHAIYLLNQLLTNPSINKHKKNPYLIHHLLGVIYANHNRPYLAKNAFNTALKKSHKIEHGLVQSSILAQNGFFKLALEHLEITERYHDKDIQTLKKSFFKKYYKNEIDQLKQKIQEDLYRK